MLITGCRDTQTSADAQIGGSFNGALTYYLVESIKETKGNLTYRELHNGLPRSSRAMSTIKFLSWKDSVLHSIVCFSARECV